MAKARIGISGWRYPPWRGTFYPNGLVQREELDYASRQVDSIEINGSFYALQSAANYAHWYGQTPRGFMFSVKAPRFITHVRRLRDIEGPLANFMASGILELREKLGPILWQFPPSMAFDPERFVAFLEQLPHDTEKAGMLARGHDGHLHGPASVKPDKKRKLRHAIEVRHESFAVPDFIALLRKYKVALVVADTAGKWPYMEDVTADFMYLRLHGDEAIYASGYTEKALEAWSGKVASWMAGGQPREGTRISTATLPRRATRDVFVYFDNDLKVKAPHDAARLRDMLDA